MEVLSKEISKIDPKEFGLDEKSVSGIEKAFLPKIEERNNLEIIYSQVIKKELNEETFAEAKELRLKLVKVRTGIASIHKSQKAYYLAAGKFVDAWKNKETTPVEQMEEKLGEIEKYQENLEKERVAKIEAERKELISKYVEDVDHFSFSYMNDSDFETFLSIKKKQYEDRIEAEKKAESERLAKIEAEKLEQERIKKENEQLKKAAEEKAKLDKTEADKRAKAEAERLAKEAVENKKREEKAAKEKAEYEAELKKEREERERIQRIENEKRIALENELRAKKDAEEKAAKEAAELEQRELNKGDADKVKDLLNELNTIKEKYSFKSEKNKKMFKDTCLLIDKVINHINK